MSAIRMFALLLTLSVLLVSAPAPLPAQARQPDAFARFEPAAVTGIRTDSVKMAPVAAPRDPVTLAFAGVLGGAVGLAAGVQIGGRLRDGQCEDCGLAGAVYGGLIGELGAVPLGVHLANRRRGNYALGLLGSLVVTGVGLAIAKQVDEAELLLAVPVLQVLTAIAIERATSRSRRGPQGPAR